MHAANIRNVTVVTCANSIYFVCYAWFLSLRKERTAPQFRRHLRKKYNTVERPLAVRCVVLWNPYNDGNRSLRTTPVAWSLPFSDREWRIVCA